MVSYTQIKFIKIFLEFLIILKKIILLNLIAHLQLWHLQKNDEVNIVKLANDKMYSIYEKKASKKLSSES